MTEPKKLARIAGALYLVVAVTTIFAGLVNTRVAVSADNIRADATLYRIGMVSELVGATAFLFTAMVLYVLLKHVSQLVAAAMVTLVAISVAMQSLNLLNQNTALTVAPNRGDLAMLFAGMQTSGFLIAQTYFGLWLLPLGYLVMKSGYFPKALGVLLMIGCGGHLVDVFTRLLSPGFGADISPFALTLAAIAEISFIAWLLIKAVRTPSTPTVRLATA